MIKNLIFWQEPLRIAGPAAKDSVAAKLRAMLSTRQFGMHDRLTGTIDAGKGQVRVWKTTALGNAGDVVEFDATLRAENGGTVIEGRLRYRLYTKIQFIGLLVMGVAMLLSGAFQKLHSTQPNGDLLAIGGIVTFITLLWIYASSQMRHTQIQFIEARLREIVSN